MALETGKVATDLLISGVAKSNEPAMIVQNNTQGRPVKEKSKEKEDDMEGLPADVAAVNALQAQYMADGQISIQEENILKRRIASLKPRLDTWKKARDIVAQNNASGEYAINDRGFAYVKNDKGKIERRHINTLNKYDKDRILTYGQLLDETFNTYAFDDEMLNTVGNAVTASMAQEKLIKKIKQADLDEASATSGSGGVSAVSGLEGWMTTNKRNHKKWTGLDNDKYKAQFSQLTTQMDANDRNALILKGRLSGEDIGNNDVAAVFESLVGWTGRSIEDEIIENTSYSSPGVSSYRKKNGEDNDDIITSSQVALNVLSDPNIQTADYNFGDNGKISLKAANATQTLNSSGTAFTTAETLGELLNAKGSATTDKMSFYLRDYIYIGNVKVDKERYNTIEIDGNNMKTAFIPFRDGKPDLEVLNAVANIAIDKENRMIGEGNIEEIANELNNYINKKYEGKYDNIKIIDVTDPEDRALVIGNTIADAISSYFNRNYEKDFKDGKSHPCDICYSTFSIGGSNDKTTFSKTELEDKKDKNGKIEKKVLGLIDVKNLFKDNDTDNEKARFMYKDNYIESVTSAYNNRKLNPPAFLKEEGNFFVGRGLLILPHKTGEWARSFNVDYAQTRKEDRTWNVYNSNKTKNAEGVEKNIFKDVKGNNQYTPSSN